jgi:hypothetical protein
MHEPTCCLVFANQYDPFVIHLNPHLRASTHFSTFEVLQAKEYTPILFSSVIFNLGFTFESIKEFGGVLKLNISNIYSIKCKNHK